MLVSSADVTLAMAYHWLWELRFQAKWPIDESDLEFVVPKATIWPTVYLIGKPHGVRMYGLRQVRAD